MKKGFKVGPYEIGRELGRGATGTVYEGIDHLNELTVAIKVIKHSQTSKRLLLHEIDVSQRLPKPTVRLYFKSSMHRKNCCLAQIEKSFI